MRKIRIPMSLLEESHNPKRVEEDRSIAIEVSVVRRLLFVDVYWLQVSWMWSGHDTTFNSLHDSIYPTHRHSCFLRPINSFIQFPPFHLRLRLCVS